MIQAQSPKRRRRCLQSASGTDQCRRFFTAKARRARRTQRNYYIYSYAGFAGLSKCGYGVTALALTGARLSLSANGFSRRLPVAGSIMAQINGAQQVRTLHADSVANSVGPLARTLLFYICRREIASSMTNRNARANSRFVICHPFSSPYFLHVSLPPDTLSITFLHPGYRLPGMICHHQGGELRYSPPCRNKSDIPGQT